MKKDQINYRLASAIRAIFWGIPLITGSFTSTALYAAPTQQISITKNSLDQVLKQLAIQTATTMSYDAKSLAKLPSAGLVGNYSTEQALAILLQPHPLNFVKLSHGGYSIVARNITTAMTSTNTDDPTLLATIVVSASGSPILTTEGSTSYTAQATTAATGLALSLKETPQLVSVFTRQQMDDQNLTLLTDIATQTAGLSIAQSGSLGTDGANIYARGQQVNNYLLDGVKLLGSYSSIFQSQDMALFDRVEVVRGASGLMTGSGTASASMNMVRKKPLQEFKASVSANLGSWNAYRTEVDVSTPLNQAGSIRGRTVMAYQQSDSYIDRANDERKIAYAVVEGDLSENTIASLGFSYQQINLKGIASRGLPSFYSDGTAINWSRSASAAADWTYSDRQSTTYFADFEHHFNSRWQLKGVASRTITDSDEVVGYVYSAKGIDKETGKGAMIYSTRWDYEPTQDLFNLTLNGSFDLFNQSHDLVIGATYAKSENQRPSYGGWNNDMTWPSEIDNIFTWNGHQPARPETMISGWYSSDDRSQSLFTALRLKPIDPMAIIVGARVEDWKRVTGNYTQSNDKTTFKTLEEKGEIVPYIGVTYDLTDLWTAYASYTTIFSPQDRKTVDGDYLDPVRGNSTEVGIKAAFFDNQLNIGAALYQTKEDNKAVAVTGIFAPDGSQAYRAESGTKSKGFELEATGKLSDAWQISTSFSRDLSQDQNGKSLNSNVPSNTAKLFTTYTLPYLNEALTLGGGIRWQSAISNNLTPNNQRFEQDSYALVDLMARYKVNEQLTANLNVNNLFNENYALTAGNSYYGAPTNFRVGLKYQW